MCGIAGIVELRGRAPSPEMLKMMGNCLHHRGPDGEGFYIDGPCGLVHRRLAIVDPAGGAQPLSNEDQTVWITYNGEVYNAPALRPYLEGKGHSFRTNTDTEVIIHLYEEDPVHFVEQLEGIFTFAIWDTHRRSLTLARDYLGVKPLYYYTGPDCFIFGSEVKALFVDPRVPCEPDLRGIIELLAFQNNYPAQTNFKDISLLAGGECYVVRPDDPGALTSSRRFWHFEAQDPYPGTRAEAAADLRELVETVVQDQLMSDVPVATYLSGGMDSSTITAISGRHLHHLMTFSGGFFLDGAPAHFQGYDERDAAYLMSEHFGTEHYFRQIEPYDHVENFTAIIWHLEEPRVSTCYAPWVIAREAGSRVKVILSGHGGDELFAGYHYKYYPAQRIPPQTWEDSWFKHLNWLMPVDQARDWLTRDFMTPELLAWPRQAFDRFVRESKGLTSMGRAQHHDLFVYMHGLLFIEDKLSMAHSLESRVPFLDRRLFRFVWSLPDAWKADAHQGKRILREALKGLVPDEILARDKMGFGPPDNFYYRTSLMPFVWHMLFGDGGFANRGIVRPEKLRELFAMQIRGSDLQQQLWTCMSLEMWFRTFFDRTADLRFREANGSVDAVELNIPDLVVTAAQRQISPEAALPEPIPQIKPRRGLRHLARRAVKAARNPGLAARRLMQESWFAAPLTMIKGTLRGMYYGVQGALHTEIVCKAWKAVHNPRLAMRRLRTVLSSRAHLFAWPVWSLQTHDYMATWWRMVSGSYGVKMRAELTQRLVEIPTPKREGGPRIFFGLYHAPQPPFLVREFRARGLTSIYETIDRNPGFPAVDVYHQIHHPNTYREHAKIDEDVLVHVHSPIANAKKLRQLETFFLDCWSKYDVFHFNWFISFLADNIDVEYIRRSGRLVYFHFRGCFVLTKIINDFTERGQTVADACRYCKQMGWREEYFARFDRAIRHSTRVFTSTPNLCHCSPDFEYIPNSLEPSLATMPPPMLKAKVSGAPIVVMHSAFNEKVHAYKGTPHIVRAVETLKAEGLNVEFKLIEKMSRAEAVAQYGDCDVFVEQLHLGSYGNVGIEAMAYGLPVISSHAPEHAHLAPGCPVVHADPTTITDRLRELVLDPDRRTALAQRSFEWVRQFHNNNHIVDHLLRIYEEDLGWRIECRQPNNIMNREPYYGE